MQAFLLFSLFSGPGFWHGEAKNGKKSASL
jgi:hypothetical protein